MGEQEVGTFACHQQTSSNDNTVIVQVVTRNVHPAPVKKPNAREQGLSFR